MRSLEKIKPYQSYLLRCWLQVESEADTRPTYRFIVESISDAPQRWGFATFEELIVFLQAELIQREQHIEPNDLSYGEPSKTGGKL